MSELFVCGDDWSKFIKEAMGELSLNEHNGICNIAILAVTNNGEPISIVDNISDFGSVAIMATHFNSLVLAHEIICNKGYYQDLFSGEEPDMYDPDNPPTDEELREIEND